MIPLVWCGRFPTGLLIVVLSGAEVRTGRIDLISPNSGCKSKLTCS